MRPFLQFDYRRDIRNIFFKRRVIHCIGVD
jgi:hypothetical protein